MTPYPSLRPAVAPLEPLVDELTEALEETVRIATAPATRLEWEVHLDYLRAMQRVARTALAAPKLR